MANCKRCDNPLSGKQRSYCSFYCSHLHLKTLYRRRKRDTVNAYNRKWRKQHRDNVNQWTRDSKKRKLGILKTIAIVRKVVPHIGELTAKQRFEILKRDDFTCRYCGRSAPTVELHVDHITPLERGGTNEDANLVTACSECNIGKGSILLSESEKAA